MIKKFLSEGIDPFFFEYTTGKPFEKCGLCDDPLEHKTYAIEKVMRRNKQFNTSEIVYEYAVCMDCAGNMKGEISEESMQTITNTYQEHNQNLLMKLDYLHSTDKYTLQSWLERCSFTGQPINTCEEYVVSAVIEDSRLVYEHGPLVVSDTFIELLTSKLSKSTKESFDGLRDKIVDGAPGIEDIINTPVMGIF